MNIWEMKEQLVEYASCTPIGRQYVVRGGFASYFKGIHTKIYYKSGDNVKMYQMGEQYVKICVNGLCADCDIPCKTIDSIIRNRFFII